MNNTTISLDRIYALVVGVESYGEKEWKQEGPANDALNFTRWLLSRGVRRKNISLFISPHENLPENLESSIRELINPACQDAITTAIDCVLLDRDRSGDLLYIFWSGHGFMTSGQQLSRRNLFYSDSDLKNYRNLDVTSLLHSLRTSTQGSGFRFQFCFIDACSNRIFQDQWQINRVISASDRRTPNGEQRQQNQAILYAAPMYGVTGNNNREREGVFSKVLLKNLSELPQDRILIDPQDLIDGVRNQLLGAISFETYGQDFGEIKNEIIQTLGYQEPCVDREIVLRTFERMLRGEISEHVLLIQGEKDFGKTWLLDNCFQKKISNSMFSVKLELRMINQSVEYVFCRSIKKIEESIKKIGSTRKFAKFKKILKKYFPELNDKNPIEMDQIKRVLQFNKERRASIVHDLLKAFVRDLKDISENRINNETRKIILLFDSVNDSNTEVARFLFDFLEEIHDLSNIIVVICGQAVLKPPSDVHSTYKYFNLCDEGNAIDVFSWQNFVQEYRQLGEPSYGLIEPNEIALVVGVLKDQSSARGEQLAPMTVIDQLKRLNGRKKEAINR